MIQVFCKEVGAGKTKELISLANKKLINTKGDSVYIDKNSKYSKEIDRRIRFVSTGDYGTLDCESFYGLLCGIISRKILYRIIHLKYQYSLQAQL